MQSHQKVLCGICGGIAAYKTVDVVSTLHKAGIETRVVMSAAATKFITPLAFQAVTGQPVGTDFFCEPSAHAPTSIYPHIYPASECELFVVLPATADMISKLVCGQADDPVCGSALALDAGCIRVFCPAMNVNMWNNPVVQQNVKTLEDRGWLRIGPATGRLACGTEGIGRMPSPSAIAEELLHLLQKPLDLAGKSVLILSGPTREHFDPVRYIGNPSSGKMGRALAVEAAGRGADVHVISGPVAHSEVPQGPRITVEPVTSAEQMLQAASTHFQQADVILFAAAVADYTPVHPSAEKQPKSTSDLTLQLKPTPDIAATLCPKKQPHQLTIGFALQDSLDEEKARQKLKIKHLDMIVLNEVASMGAEEAAFRCLKLGSDTFDIWGTLAKSQCAARIFDAAVETINSAN